MDTLNHSLGWKKMMEMIFLIFGTEINPFDAFWKMFERLGRL